MITRFAIVCPGCAEPFVVRLGMAPTKFTRFYLPCPNCQLPVRGTSQGEELDTHRVDFEAERFEGQEEPRLVITVDPNVPCRYDAAEMGSFGSAPTMTLYQLAGDRMLELMGYLSRSRQAVDEFWPQVRRLYEYYLEGDWRRFDQVGMSILKEKWPSVETTHQRATLAHQMVGIVAAMIIDDRHEASARFMHSYLRKHSKSLKSCTSYVEFARHDAESGLLATLLGTAVGLVDTGFVG